MGRIFPNEPDSGSKHKNMELDAIDALEVLKALGRDAINRGNLTSALDHFSAALRIAPADANILTNRAHIYIKLNAFSEALEDTEQVGQTLFIDLQWIFYIPFIFFIHLFSVLSSISLFYLASYISGTSTTDISGISDASWSCPTKPEST